MPARLQLFQAFGVELEYMLVDATTLDVRPVADQLLRELAGRPVSDFQRGQATWSNELTAHVIELKCSQPAPDLAALAGIFADAIAHIEPALQRLNLRLLPTAMHPWMNPLAETRLWPLEGWQIYQTFDRIFDCRQHGWANVQSAHLNLPFDGAEQFNRLHAAVRLVLPLLPALAASSPIVECRRTGPMDNRLVHYARHCDRAASMTGELIPEPVFEEAEYRRVVFEPIAREIRPLDHAHVMDVEFLNARAAIARFDRGSIEIRLLDVQEYPAADLAICSIVIEVLKGLVAERWSSHAAQRAMPTAALRRTLGAAINDAEQAVIDDADLLAHFGVDRKSLSAAELWQRLREAVSVQSPAAAQWKPLELIADQGTLARRISASVGEPCTREVLFQVYSRLGDCLRDGRAFQP
jgi:hypothetical protein